MAAKPLVTTIINMDIAGPLLERTADDDDGHDERERRRTRASGRVAHAGAACPRRRAVTPMGVLAARRVLSACASVPSPAHAMTRAPETAPHQSECDACDGAAWIVAMRLARQQDRAGRAEQVDQDVGRECGRGAHDPAIILFRKRLTIGRIHTASTSAPRGRSTAGACGLKTKPAAVRAGRAAEQDGDGLISHQHAGGDDHRRKRHAGALAGRHFAGREREIDDICATRNGRGRGWPRPGTRRRDRPPSALGSRARRAWGSPSSSGLRSPGASRRPTAAAKRRRRRPAVRAGPRGAVETEARGEIVGAVG